MNNDRVSTIKDQGLLNKQRITFIKKGLKNKVETQSGTKTTFSLETLLLCWLPQTNPATVVLMSWRISPEPSRSPAAADTDPQRAPGGESRASSLGLPVWRCFLPPFSSRRKDRETFSGPVERKEKPTLVKKKLLCLVEFVFLSLFFFLNDCLSLLFSPFSIFTQRQIANRCAVTSVTLGWFCFLFLMGLEAR